MSQVINPARVDNVTLEKNASQEIQVKAPLATAKGGTGSVQAANSAGGVVVPAGAVNAANGAVVLDANGKIPVSQLGGLVDKSASYGAQQAATDGEVTAYTTDYNETAGLSGYTDANADPVLCIAKSQQRPYGGTGRTFISFTVKKGNYWKVVVDLGTIDKVYWRPFGS